MFFVHLQPYFLFSFTTATITTTTIILPLNHKRTDHKQPIFYIAKKWQSKDRRFPIRIHGENEDGCT